MEALAPGFVAYRRGEEEKKPRELTRYPCSAPFFCYILEKTNRNFLSRLYVGLYLLRRGRTMPEELIEKFIDDVLAKEARKNAADFFKYLMKSGMQFERGKGYWEDKLYWMIKYKNEYVCFVLINGSKDKTEPNDWVIWSDDSGSAWFENSSLDEHTNEIAWRHIDICGNCGGCKNPGGSHKTIFGKDFDNVCITTMRFDNPDTETVECVKKLVELRKNDILEKHI